MGLWGDWAMMNRLHCTWTELQDEPYDKLLVFQEFAKGEAAAEVAIRQESK